LGGSWPISAGEDTPPAEELSHQLSGGNDVKKHGLTLVLGVAALIFALSFTAYAQDSVAEELAALLQDLSGVLGELVDNGFTIEHFELDSLVLQGTYPVEYQFFAGYEYIVVGIGGPAITDLDLYLYDNEGNQIAHDLEYGRFPTLLFDVEESGLLHVFFRSFRVANGYSEELPYYFAFVIAAR
jgi:hypothetical protein